MKLLSIKEIAGLEADGRGVTVKGWVRTKRAVQVRGLSRGE